MLECGEPLHAFDYTLLRGRQIVVRRARDGESMATLDGVQRPITPAMLVIADAERPVALAGIMGGAGSEIRDETRTVLLESAVFAPPLIRRTTSTLGLSTESSHRYERGVDVGAADWCSRRAARLMAELAGATIARGVRDEFPAGLPDRRVACRFARTRDLLGYPVSDDRVVSILESLALPVVSRTAEACVVQVPSFRPDLELEADLIEEVARMNGLDKVPEVIPQCRIIPGATDKATQATMRCRERLVGLGLSEIMNYSFLSRQLLDVVGAEDGRRRVELPNPVSQDYAVMRPSLLPQMVESLGRNMARQVPEAAFFELGRVFLRSEDGGIREEERLSLGLMGRVGRLGVGVLAPLQDDEAFLCMKGVVEAFLYAQHVCDYRVERTDVPCFKSGRSVIFSRDGQRIGVMGLLSDAVRRNWRMGEPVAVGEFLLSAVLNDTARVGGGLQPLPAFPAVARDVAMVVAETITHEEIVKTIRKSAPKELTQIVLFDIFRSEGIGSGRKSMAYSLVYRSAERTLTDEEANGFHETVKAALRSELKAEVRES
jgi:phenylalanyl-tRNA synthetase beta chain